MCWALQLWAVAVLNGLVGALDNGQALTPPMGWLSWTRFKCDLNCTRRPDDCVSERLYKAMADRLVDDGYLAAGYNRLNVDDCWMQRRRAADGQLQADPDRFAHGMRQLGEYVHSRGLLYGMYATYGKTTCMGFAGTQIQHMHDDAQLFAGWNVDYLKFDGCFNDVRTLEPAYIKMGAELNATGRAIVYACSWPFYLLADGHIQPDYSLVSKHCNLWRNYNDIESNWASILSIINFYDHNERKLAQFHGPGAWNDPDMLVIGNPGVSLNHCRVQMALWCIWAAPLLMSNDLRHMAPGTRRILLNSRLIAVNQDPLGHMGTKLLMRDGVHIYAKKVHPIDAGYKRAAQEHYSYAFVFFNRQKEGEVPLRVKLIELGLTHPRGYVLTDLMGDRMFPGVWRWDDLLELTVPAEDVFALRASISATMAAGRQAQSTASDISHQYLIVYIVFLLCAAALLWWFIRKLRYRPSLLLVVSVGLVMCLLFLFVVWL